MSRKLHWATCCAVAVFCLNVNPIQADDSEPVADVQVAALDESNANAAASVDVAQAGTESYALTEAANDVSVSSDNAASSDTNPPSANGGRRRAGDRPGPGARRGGPPGGRGGWGPAPERGPAGRTGQRGPQRFNRSDDDGPNDFRRGPRSNFAQGDRQRGPRPGGPGMQDGRGPGKGRGGAMGRGRQFAAGGPNWGPNGRGQGPAGRGPGGRGFGGQVGGGPGVGGPGFAGPPRAELESLRKELSALRAAVKELTSQLQKSPAGPPTTLSL